jgi:uncharacterized protein YndB with AHSA1/START domain
MDTVIIIIVAIVVLLAALLGYAATKPNSFQIQRSANFKAPPEKIFALINDFHQWPGWSPWEKLDPEMKRTHSGTASGLGAIYEWEGNKKVGKGRMEITESTSPTKIVINLDFLKPFEAHNTTVFALQSQSDSTSVTWTMHGQQPFMFKVMTTYFMNMDKLVGKDFETGLANMKTIAET